MISIVVITSGLLYVMRVYSTARETLNRSRDLFRHSFMLEEKMYDFEERGVIEEGKEEGKFPDASDYSWETDAEPLEPEGQNLSGLCAVKLSSYSNKSATPYKYTIFTYLENKKTL